jgi:SPW repeat
VTVALGMWLSASAFVLRPASGTAVPEDVITGLFVALAGMWAARAFRPLMSLAASWTVVLTGLWATAAPFVLQYERRSSSVANEVIVGLVIVALETANALTKATGTTRSAAAPMTR